MEPRKSLIPLPAKNYSIRSVKPIVSRQQSKEVRQRSPIREINYTSPERVYQLIPELKEKILETQIEATDLETIIKLFKRDKQVLRPIIYKALPQIIENYYIKEKLPQNVNRQLFYYDLDSFANDLFEMEEYVLVKKIIELADPEDYIYEGLVNTALNNQDKLEVYFKMAPENHDFGYFEEIFEDSIGEGRMTTEQYRKYLGSALRAAINTKNIYVLEYLISFWQLERVFWTNQNKTDHVLGVAEENMVKEIDYLIEQARSITENYDDLIAK